MNHRPCAESGESTQIVPQTIGVAFRQERFHLQVGILPDRRSVGEQGPALSRQTHPSTTPVCRIRVTLTRPRRSSGLTAAVKVVRSMASSDATDPMPGGSGRFNDMSKEN